MLNLILGVGYFLSRPRPTQCKDTYFFYPVKRFWRKFFSKAEKIANPAYDFAHLSMAMIKNGY